MCDPMSKPSMIAAWLLAAAVCGAAASAADNEPPNRYNVLFIAVDDLRPDLGCYGDRLAKTPHMDRLAASGVYFRRAYCQQAVCNPSRVSLLTGLRPESIGVLDLPTRFRDKRPDVVTLPQYFKQQGYVSQRFGKIYHLGHGNHDDAVSWSSSPPWKRAPRFGPEGARLLERLKEQAKTGAAKSQVRGLPWEAPDVPDDALTDGNLARNAIRAMRRLRNKPFFLAVGFVNPHLPFVAPKSYWDLYDPAEIKLADNPQPPRDSPQFAWTNWGELRAYHGIPSQGPLTEQQARRARHGYLAATSYVDAQVGRLLDELDRLDLRRNTVVILWGDHGWQLGEHGFWCKHTNYEVANRVPLILSVPNQPRPGRPCDRLVEFVDIYPSLVELCGLPPQQGLEGVSFAPLLQDPERPWKTAAFHVYPRRMPGKGRALGRAIRTETHRLVEWRPLRGGDPVYELYDLVHDPDENQNLAGRDEHAATQRRLVEQLRLGWRAAKPDVAAVSR